MNAVLSPGREIPARPPIDLPARAELRVVPATAPLVSIRNLSVAFDDGTAVVPVLYGVDLDIRAGEALGIVGESGCGKSVTWMAVLGLLGPRARVSGTVHLAGAPIHDLRGDRLAAIRGKRIAMIFQDPSSALNPVLRIGRQLTESLELHRGLRGAAARAEALRLLERVHIPGATQRLASYPHELSGGMNQRVMIAMALAGEPDLLVADEPTTALDATIQAQILDLLDEIRRDSGMALALISHDLGVIAEVCERVVVMYAGRVVEQAPAARLFTHPRHPYTRGLLDALPDLARVQQRLPAIPGQVPEPRRMPRGCAFGPRCDRFSAGCEAALPLPVEVAPGHHAACYQPHAA